MSRYAVIADGTVVNVTVCDDPTFAQAHGWVDIDSVTPAPEVGWVTPDGKTFTPPATPVAVANVAAIEKAITSHLGQIEAWLAANPNGAILTAQQTAFLARMLVGLGRLIMGMLDTTGQAT